MPSRSQTKAVVMKQGGLQGYLLRLGAVLYYDGLLNGANIANRGSGGSVLDGVPAGVTIDSNGMNFDGAAASGSNIALASASAVAGLAAYTYIQIAYAVGAGAASGGRLWDYANNGTHAGFVSGANLVLRVARTGQASSTFTNFFPSYPQGPFIVFMGWSGTAITGHAAKLGATSLTTGTNADGSGAVTDISAQQLNVGNRTLLDRTWSGYQRVFAIINRTLSDAERNTTGQLAGILAA